MLLASYRRTGADPPWGDPRRYHGVAMEGYFWRFTQASGGQVAIVMCGISRARDGERWAFVGLAAHPGGFFRWAALQDARADAAGYGVRAGEAFSGWPRPRAARPRPRLPAGGVDRRAGRVAAPRLRRRSAAPTSCPA